MNRSHTRALSRTTRAVRRKLRGGNAHADARPQILETPSLLAESATHPSMLRVTGGAGAAGSSACGC